MKLRKLGLLAAAATVALASAGGAQMTHMNMPGMHMPGMKMPAPKKKATAAKKKVTAAKKPAAKKATTPKSTGAKKATAKQPAARKAAAKTRPASKSDPMAGHDMSAMPGMEMPADKGGTTMPAMDMPAGQDHSAMPGMVMPSTTGMSGMAPSPDTEAAGTNLAAGNAPPPAVPSANAADQIYGSDAMAMGRHHLQRFHGGQKLAQVMVNRAEYLAQTGGDGFAWDAQGWYGGDINRVWLKSEGEGAFSHKLERGEVQALYSRAIDPYWNIQGGLRYDFKPDPSRVYAAIGVEGLAPSFFDLEGTLFLSNKGELMARAEGYYDQRITQRLILQPRVELNLAAQNSRDIGTGTGLSDAELGLRLRYDIRRDFAPYVGVQYQRAFRRTRGFRRAAGEDVGGWAFLAGVRTWF